LEVGDEEIGTPYESRGNTGAYTVSLEVVQVDQ
jgi:exosome complex RNA-binding protein Rrp42 (RNase PH superfamily)